MIDSWDLGRIGIKLMVLVSRYGDSKFRILIIRVKYRVINTFYEFHVQLEFYFEVDVTYCSHKLHPIL